MTKTKPAPWVIRLLQHCTAGEQFALSRYRSDLGRAHWLHTRGHRTHDQVTRAWTDALNQLADAAEGSPPLDEYVQRQLRHLEQWASDGRGAGAA